ncbi:MAG: chromosomal replication initiator protein DnaA [Bacteroidales bacterium]|nr:chromosomal replication initiator protein DnaA [Bacteroidales bacterium]
MEKNHTSVWEECLKIFRDNLGDSANYKAWFSPIKAVKLENSTLTIQVPSQFFCEWLEEHYVDLLRSAIKRTLGPEGRLEYSVIVDNTNPYVVTAESGYKKETRNQPTAMPIPQRNQQLPDPFIIPGIKKIKVNSQLNPTYSFDNFVEGECNRLARSVGYSIAEKPGKTGFNPLFLYSPIGLGKTHLMNAIGLQAKLNYPDLTVLYVSAELFTQQFVDACKNNTTNDFTHFYQLIDVLLIDDIHKLAGKDKTQDAFFQIFNQLHQSGKQIIISSDKPPVELQGIDQRLLSRFKWGLAAELQVPDVETRIAILQKKLHSNGVEMPKDVIEYIAYSISTNVREMEGVLNSLLAQSIHNKKTITMELARKMIDQIVHNSAKEISIDYIQKVICDHFELPVDKIHSNTRRREIVIARQLAMYFAKKHTKNSLASIGAQCGKRDHATVLHACKTIQNLIDTDKSFKGVVEELDKKIKN